MKLIIDIPEQIWEMVVNTGTFGCYRFNTSRAIRKGTPLESVLEDIRSEIEEHTDEKYGMIALGCGTALQIIDKHMRGTENESSD